MADNNPEELREVAEAALVLCTIKNSTFDVQTNRTLQELRNKYLGRSNGGEGNPVAENDSVPISENPPELPIEEAVPTGNLPPAPLLPQFEPPIPAWNPPPVASLNGLIGNCSRPIEKQLTYSDVRYDKGRLSILKADAENFLLPLLNPEENLENGIPVSVYDSTGKKYKMEFKIWGGRMYVLTGLGWKEFCQQHTLQTRQDPVTLWMFRHVRTQKLCFVIITSRRRAI